MAINSLMTDLLLRNIEIGFYNSDNIWNFYNSLRLDSLSFTAFNLKQS